MKLYGGYKGARVAKKNLKLFKGRGGKRLAKKPIEDNLFYQTIQLISGKVKAFIGRIEELSGYVDYEEMDQEFLSLPSYKEEPNFLDLGETKIVTIQASSLDDIDDVIYFLEKKCIVFVNYGILATESRREFDKRLSIELMQLGTHLTHISSAEIICAGREVLIEDKNAKKTKGKIYDLSTVIKR